MVAREEEGGSTVVMVPVSGGPFDGMRVKMENAGACWIEKEGILYEYWVKSGGGRLTLEYMGINEDEA